MVGFCPCTNFDLLTEEFLLHARVFSLAGFKSARVSLLCMQSGFCTLIAWVLYRYACAKIKEFFWLSASEIRFFCLLREYFQIHQARMTFASHSAVSTLISASACFYVNSWVMAATSSSVCLLCSVISNRLSLCCIFLYHWILRICSSIGIKVVILLTRGQKLLC
jgi:hypothetical protein